MFPLPGEQEVGRRPVHATVDDHRCEGIPPTFARSGNQKEREDGQSRHPGDFGRHAHIASTNALKRIRRRDVVGSMERTTFLVRILDIGNSRTGDRHPSPRGDRIVVEGTDKVGRDGRTSIRTIFGAVEPRNEGVAIDRRVSNPVGLARLDRVRGLSKSRVVDRHLSRRGDRITVDGTDKLGRSGRTSVSAGLDRNTSENRRCSIFVVRDGEKRHHGHDHEDHAQKG